MSEAVGSAVVSIGAAVSSLSNSEELSRVATAIAKSLAPLCADGYYLTQDCAFKAAQAAIDAMQEPILVLAPSPQGPEMTAQEMAQFKAIWGPISDVLRGDAP